MRYSGVPGSLEEAPLMYTEEKAHLDAADKVLPLLRQLHMSLLGKKSEEKKTSMSVGNASMFDRRASTGLSSDDYLNTDVFMKFEFLR